MENPVLRIRFAWLNWKRDFPLYLRTIRLNPEFGRIDSAPAYESEYPYREGTALVFRVVGTLGFTVGVMNNHTDQSDKAVNQRLFRAITGTDGGEEYTRKAQKNMEEWLGQDELESMEEWLQKAVPSAQKIGVEDTIDPEN